MQHIGISIKNDSTKETAVYEIYELSRNPNGSLKQVIISKFNAAEFDGFFSEIVGKPTKSLVYVHGMMGTISPILANCLWQVDDLFKAEELGYETTFWFLWGGKNFRYARNLREVNYFIEHSEPVLNALKELSTPITMLSISMGARIANGLAERWGEKNQIPLLDKLILTAPDIDSDHFEGKSYALQNFATQIHVLTDRYDRILRVSEWINKKKRLGQKVELKKTSVPGLKLHDFSERNHRRKGTDLLMRHSYFRYDHSAIETMKNILI